MAEFVRCATVYFVSLFLLYKVEAFTQQFPTELNEVGIRVCEYEGFRWLKGDVEFLDTCMKCSCDGGAVLPCSSTSFRYTGYPSYCKAINVGCSQILVMADNLTQECERGFLWFESMVGK